MASVQPVTNFRVQLPPQAAQQVAPKLNLALPAERYDLPQDVFQSSRELMAVREVKRENGAKDMAQDMLEKATTLAPGVTWRPRTSHGYGVQVKISF